MNINKWVYASVAILGMSSHVQATPTGSLVFNEPTGTVGPHDVVEVSVKLTLDADSEKLAYSDLSGAPADWLSVTGKAYAMTYVCSDTFTGHCSDTPYDYTFHPGSHGINILYDRVVEPGASVDFVWLDFVPTVSSVPSGTYSLFQLILEEGYYGTKLQQQLDADGNPILDMDGNPVLAESYIQELKTIAQVCADFYGAGCSGNQVFTRTVSAVAEPEVYAMWLASMGLLGLVRRRHWFV